MPHIQSEIFRMKGKKKNLVIELSEDEEILNSIRRAMLEHKLDEAKVVDISGRVKEATVNYFERNEYRHKELKEEDAVMASGAFKLNAGDLWGSMSVTFNKRRPLTATLVRGRAADGLQIKLQFVEMEK